VEHVVCSMCVVGVVVDESTGSSVANKSSSTPVDRPSVASPSSSDSELPEDLLASEPSRVDDVHMNDDDPSLIKNETGMDDDDDVDVNFYPRRNRVDGALLNSVVPLDHDYVRLLTPDDHTAVNTALNANVTIKQEPLDADYKDEVSEDFHYEFGGTYPQPENDGHPGVKTEDSDDLYSAALSSPESFGMSESDGDDLYDSENSDEYAFDSEHSSDRDSFSDIGEPVRKKIRVSFGVDAAVEESMIGGSVVIDSDVLEDPKMHMTPVVELEDVLQIILAWQQNSGETDDIM